MVAAFLASATILCIAAWFVISSARAYIAADQRVDERLQADAVLSRLSSTIDAAPRDIDHAALAKDVRRWLAAAAAERDDARRALYDLQLAACLVALGDSRGEPSTDVLRQRCAVDAAWRRVDCRRQPG